MIHTNVGTQLLRHESVCRLPRQRRRRQRRPRAKRRRPPIRATRWKPPPRQPSQRGAQARYRPNVPTLENLLDPTHRLFVDHKSPRFYGEQTASWVHCEHHSTATESGGAVQKWPEALDQSWIAE